MQPCSRSRPGRANVPVLRYAEAAPADAVGIARLHLAVRAATYPELIPQQVLDADSFEKRLATWTLRLADPERVIVAAWRDGELGGFACATPMPERPNGREPLPGFAAYLESIYVDPALHGSGIGAGLLRGIAARLVARDLRSLALHMVVGNPARGFYEHTGARFVREERTEMDGHAWMAAAYGWSDISTLAP
jgi:GNAT superfamily N-acetyltransferase